MKWLGHLGLGCALSMLISCAHISSRFSSEKEEKHLKSTSQASHWTKGFDAGRVDPLHLQTQADFHFAKGEALSLEGQNHRALKEFKTALLYDNKSIALRERLAKEYIRMGLYGEALKEAQLVVEAEPDSVDARLLLAGLYSTLRLYEPALQQYDVVLQLDKNNENALLYKGSLLMDQERLTEALAYFENLSKNKDFEAPHTAYFYVARLEQSLKGEGHQKRSLKALRKALKHKPDFLEAALIQAKTHEEMGNNEQAAEIYRDYQRKNGPQAQMAEELGTILLKMGRTQEGLEQFLELEQLEPDNQNARLRIAFILVDQGDLNGAIERLELVLQDIPDADKVRFYIAAVYEEMKNYGAARMHFEKIPPESSYYSDAVLHISYLHKLDGNVEAALRVLRSALPYVEEPKVPLLYASYLEELRRVDEAIHFLEDHLESYSAVPDFYYFLGSLWEQKGDVNISVVYLQKTLDRDSNHIQALNHLAYTLAEQNKDLDVAEKYARQALQLQPGDGYIMDTLGWVLFKKGEYKDAILLLEQALQVASHESIIAEHLGDAYYQSQLPEKAIEMYGKAYEAEKTDKGRKNIQRKISQIREQLEQSDPVAERQPAGQPSAD